MEPQGYSGIILTDGKYVPVKEVEGKPVGLVPKSWKRKGKTSKGLVILPFMDYLTHDIPVYEVALSENMFDLEQGFQKLKDLGYDLKVIVCDESMGQIVEVAKKVFPKVIIQICLTHYSRNIDKEFKVNSVSRTIKKLKKQLDHLGDSIMIPTHHHDIEKARTIVNEIADLEYEYGYLITVQRSFQKIFWKVKTNEELSEAEDELNEAIGHMNLTTYPHANALRKRYLDYYEKRDWITAFTAYPELDIPRTTNLIEGFNSTTLEIRFTSIRGFEKEEYARNYINALILQRRFQKFTDCRGKFKHLNGKSPLEIAQPKNTLLFKSYSQDWVHYCKKLKQKVPK